METTSSLAYEALYKKPSIDYGSTALRLCKPKDFRLLELRGCSKDGVVHCDLRVENLNNTGLTYKALSYTWGPATRRELNRLPGGASNNEQRKHSIASLTISGSLPIPKTLSPLEKLKSLPSGHYYLFQCSY